MTKHNWIVLKYDVNPNELLCTRCNKIQVMPEGSMPIDIYIVIVNAFAKLHKKCKVNQSEQSTRTIKGD